MDGDGDGVRMAGQSLVDAVIHHFIDHVVQARAVISITDIHPGALAHSIQPLENLDRIRAVVVFAGRVVRSCQFSLDTFPGTYRLSAGECHALRH
jgi:hypothetical protein